ncbi:MAG: NERD domain-containing protein, partial [Oscillospiraceae bacterium]|nr:NERD domain-containing protein [Oscillospiraceae bacterium]
MYKKRHQEKLSFRDYITLMKMSMRSWIWRHEGDSFVQNLRQVNSLAWMLTWYFILGFAIGGLGGLITGIPKLITIIFTKQSFFKALWGYCSLILVELLIFDPKKVKRSLRFTRSAWWNNTGIHPTEIEIDPGTYGEYAATMRIEEELEKSGKFGKIYNSVLIPITNHGTETYAESDIVVVTEDNIQLFEVKNHTGRITGSFRYEADTWYRNEQYDLENKYGNPLRQNQHHINYLIEYLYPLLKDKGLLDGKSPFFGAFLNAVMYADNRYCSVELDVSEIPKQAFIFSDVGTMEDGGYTVEMA